MHAARFDELLRTLSTRASRQGVVRGLAGLGLATALGSLLNLPDAEAKRRKRKKKKRKKKHKRKTRSSCTDGIRNGNETDVDCGGSCPRCQVGRLCQNRNDCQTAFCQAGQQTCEACTGFSCGSDAEGPCDCVALSGGASSCVQGPEVDSGCLTSADCPDGAVCMLTPSINVCRKLCGVS